MSKTKKKSNRISKIFNIISLVIFIILVLAIFYTMFFGGLKMLDNNFVEYIITLSFVLAGFTFFAFYEKRYKSSYWIAQSCWMFILAGFFLLAYLIIQNVNPSDWLLGFVKSLNPMWGMIGWACILMGILTLVIVLYQTVNNMAVE